MLPSNDMDVYRGLLKMFAGFMLGKENAFIYKFDDNNNDILKEKYNIDSIAGQGSSLDRAINLMRWLYSILLHEPNYENRKTDNALNLLERLKNKKSINCRATAVILTECLIAIGIPARSVWLMPFNPYDMDCHVITVAFCKEIHKWVMIDATVNTIIFNKDQVPLDPLEIRNHIINQEKLFFMPELYFYRVSCSIKTQNKGYHSYLTKNIFYFKTYNVNCFGYENSENQNLIFLIPNEFDYKKQRNIIKEDYKYPALEIIQNPIICSPNNFFSPVEFT